MPILLQVTFRGSDPSDAMESVIRHRVSRLERFSDRITRCDVTVDVPHQHRHRSNHYSLYVDIATASGNIAVKRDPPRDGWAEDLPSVVSDTFDSATRQLEEHAQRQPGNMNGDEPHTPPGRVTQLFPGDGYGFLTTAEGVQVYFNESSLVDAKLASLSVGTEVCFTLAPEDGDEVSRAASVILAVV
jgi:cold shock CspA family protein